MWLVGKAAETAGRRHPTLAAFPDCRRFVVPPLLDTPPTHNPPPPHLTRSVMMRSDPSLMEELSSVESGGCFPGTPAPRGARPAGAGSFDGASSLANLQARLDKEVRGERVVNVSC